MSERPGHEQTPAASAVFTPVRVGPLTLRNRVVKAATFEGMSPDGVPTRELVAFHERIAAGGVAMTTVAYGAVSQIGRTFAGQMVIDARTARALRPLTDAVHRHDAAAALQLAHCGFFTKYAGVRRPPRAPSWTFNAYGAMAGRPVALPMRPHHLRETREAFATAARRAAEGGFDAVELHLGHGYLLSQFLSPATNRRRDAYGGAIEDRMRFPLEVVAAVRDALPPDRALTAKINLRDGFRGGLEPDDAVAVARGLEAAGVDALETSGGFTSRTPLFLLRGGRPLAEMIRAEKNPLQRLALRAFGPKVVRAWPFEELFFLPEARAVRRAVGIPMALLGGIVSLDNMETALAEGFEMVALGRALVADPGLVDALRAGRVRRTRCNACNVCITATEGGGVHCVLDEPGGAGRAAAALGAAWQAARTGPPGPAARTEEDPCEHSPSAWPW